jgi:transposase-like protein
VGLASARARGRKGGGQYKMTAAKLRLAMAAMGQRQTVVSELCRELGVTRQTLYRHIGPDGSLREDGQKILSALWSASPGSALGGQQRTRTPGSISLTENSEIQPDPSPY